MAASSCSRVQGGCSSSLLCQLVWKDVPYLPVLFSVSSPEMGLGKVRSCHRLVSFVIIPSGTTGEWEGVLPSKTHHFPLCCVNGLIFFFSSAGSKASMCSAAVVWKYDISFLCGKIVIKVMNVASIYVFIFKFLKA